MKKEGTDYDAIVVGSGPNGLAAAITLKQAGLSVLLIEAKDAIGGGLRSAQLTLPGFIHDHCAAVHPLAIGSPYFKTLPLDVFGLKYIHPAIPMAHPLDGGKAATLYHSLAETADNLGVDTNAYHQLLDHLVAHWPELKTDILGPLRLPKHPLEMARFGLNALRSATTLSKRFKTQEAKSLWAGVAAHSIQPLSNMTTSAIGLVLLATAHSEGWPFIKGGTGKLGDALAAYFLSIGGEVQTGFYVRTLTQLPSAKAVLFDVTPKQLLQIAGHSFSALYHWQLKRYRYGMGAFKIDWALDAPIPFTAEQCRRAGTLHLGNSIEEIVQSEAETAAGKHADKPFVLLSQPSLFDSSRAPAGKHTAWAYCHVPNGSTVDMTGKIEQQVERFAPGFKERIIGRHTVNTQQLEDYNPNYIGGDINGGSLDVRQLFTRPALRLSPYRTSTTGLYICSSSTPPGGGVHGMCGYHAARRALKDIFHLRPKQRL